MMHGMRDQGVLYGRLSGSGIRRMSWSTGLEAPPTRGRHEHDLEAVEFFKTFPDNHLANNPYKIFFGQGDYTCTVADFSGTMKGPMKGADGKTVTATNKKFQLEFCTVAHWNRDGQILEERLFYDMPGMLKQIGVM